MNTGLALSAGPDSLFQDFLPSNDPHFAAADLDAIDERAQIGLAERGVPRCELVVGRRLL